MIQGNLMCGQEYVCVTVGNHKYAKIFIATGMYIIILVVFKRMIILAEAEPITCFQCKCILPFN